MTTVEQRKYFFFHRHDIPDLNIRRRSNFRVYKFLHLELPSVLSLIKRYLFYFSFMSKKCMHLIFFNVSSSPVE